MTQLPLEPVSPNQRASVFHELTKWFAVRTKTSITLAVAICFTIFWYLGQLTGVPAEPHFQASLLVQPSFFIALLVTAIGLVICTLLMRAIHPHVEEAEDPLLGVAAGLCALSCRGGPMTTVVQGASSPTIFFALAFELVLLAAMLAGCWWLLRRLRGNSQINDEPTEFKTKLMTTATAAVVMAVLMYLLAQSDAKKQALAAVGISAFVGAMIAFAAFDVRCAIWYALAPICVGVVGYLITAIMYGDWLIGQTGQPLAYPLPLDYASVGVAASMLGYWTAHKWREEAQGSE